jgi:hypothetical protein
MLVQQLCLRHGLLMPLLNYLNSGPSISRCLVPAEWPLLFPSSQIPGPLRGDCLLRGRWMEGSFHRLLRVLRMLLALDGYLFLHRALGSLECPQALGDEE